MSCRGVNGSRIRVKRTAVIVAPSAWAWLFTGEWASPFLGVMGASFVLCQTGAEVRAPGVPEMLYPRLVCGADDPGRALIQDRGHST